MKKFIPLFMMAIGLSTVVSCRQEEDLENNINPLTEKNLKVEKANLTFSTTAQSDSLHVIQALTAEDGGKTRPRRDTDGW